MAPREDVGEDPDYRFSLANERTFLAWVRTALGLLAGGVAVMAVLPPDAGPTWARLAVGLALLLLALLVPLLGYRRWRQTEVALRTGRSLPEAGLLRLMAGGLVVVTLLVLALVLL